MSDGKIGSYDAAPAKGPQISVTVEEKIGEIQRGWVLDKARAATEFQESVPRRELFVQTDTSAGKAAGWVEFYQAPVRYPATDLRIRLGHDERGTGVEVTRKGPGNDQESEFLNQREWSDSPISGEYWPIIMGYLEKLKMEGFGELGLSDLKAEIQPDWVKLVSESVAR